MKTYGNIILMTAICIVIFWMFMALQPALLAAEYSDDGVQSAPAPARFQPWQRVWQCNDIRVTATGPQPGVTVYDLGGTIWGGSQFTLVPGKGFLELDLYFNGRPCVPLR
jgi:hypothetical protein